MSTGTNADPAVVAARPSTGTVDALPRRSNPDIAIARRAFKQVWKGAIVCAAGFGMTIASSALTYVTTFPTLAQRQQLAATTRADAGLAVLLGPIASIETVGGYTAYKCFVFLTTLGAIWALLAATRLLRGEEDAGRWQLVLAGSTRAPRATAATLLALGGAVGIVFAGATVCTMLAGANPDVGFSTGEAVLYGLSLSIAPAVFVGVGAVTSQLARTRRLATGLAMGVFGVAFVLRMLGDSGPEMRWVLWLTPFGWTELIEPLTTNDLRPLVPASLTVIALVVLAIVLAARRDTGDGVLASRDTAEPRSFGLGSGFGLAARLDLPVLVAWCVGAAASGLVLGIIAKLSEASVPASMGDVLDKFGVHGSFAEQYLGVAFLLVASVVALLPASQVGAASAEETSGRLVHLAASPTTRASWFAGRLLLAAAGTLVAALAAGAATWAGAASQGVSLDPVRIIGAGLNVVPTALVALGIGAVVLALAPRAAAGTVYLLVIWSILIDLLSSMVSGLSSLDRLSLFHYMALAPATTPDPTTIAATLAAAVALCAAATFLFTRRDLHTG
jgi:ABC-2 type transport system permease protein